MPANAAHTVPSAVAVDVDRFKLSMRHLAGAVSVITVGEGEDRTGFTATSVSALSVEPPTILVSLNRNSSSWPAVQRYRSFGVNILAASQNDIADRFAGRDGLKGVQRYENAKWLRLASGASALANTLVTLDCELEEAIERHSHSILIGRVTSVILGEPSDPLVYWRGGYRQLLRHAVV